MKSCERILAMTSLYLILVAGSITAFRGQMCLAQSGAEDRRPMILIDESRGLSADLSFGLLTEILRNVGYRVESVAKTDEIVAKLLDASVLMLPPCTYGLTPGLERAILDFVGKGAGLLIVGEVDYGRYRDFAKNFGITMLPGAVCDPYLSTPIKPFHIKIVHMQKHTVTENVNAFTYDWGQALVVTSPALSLATVGNGSWYETDRNGIKDSNEESGQFTVLASSEYGKGRVVAVGDVGCFALYERLQWSPLQTYDTAKLTVNIFNWLSGNRLSGPSLEYTMTVTSDLAARHTAHVDLAVRGWSRDEMKLILGRWQDGMYYYSGLTNLVASASNGSRVNVSPAEERNTKVWILKAVSESITIRYDIAMDYVRRDFNEYGGYLGPNFGMCQAAQMFLVPANSFFSSIRLKCSLPSLWEAYGPWKQENGTFVLDSTRAAIINYGLTLGMKEFLWAAIGFGRFAAQSKMIGQTEVTILCWAGWDQSVKENIWKSSFDLYMYMTKLYGKSALLERYLAIWTPPAEDRRGICEIEWSTSQGLHTNPPGYYAFSNYAHRLFHTWNAFEPTGMSSESASEHWIVEGMNTYYNSKALVELNLLSRDRLMIGEYDWYAKEIVGTKYDVPLTESLKQGNRENFDRYIWLGYRKGALVRYVFDNVVQSVTSGSRSLDNLQSVMYDLYGGHRTSYNTKDVQKHLETLTGSSFQSLFEKYVYGSARLPLFLEGGRLSVNYTALGLPSKPIITITTQRITSPIATSATASLTLRTMTTSTELKEPETTYLVLAAGVLVGIAALAIVLRKKAQKKH